MTASPRSPDENDREIGRTIRRLRQIRRISQAALAKAVGVTSQQVHKYEVGSNRIAVARLQQIADALAVPVGSLYAADTEMPVGGAPSEGALRVAKLYDSLDTLDRQVIDDLIRALAKRPNI